MTAIATHLAETLPELWLLGDRCGPFVDFLKELGVWDPEGLAEGPDKPYVRNESALASVKPETNILDDLEVNSARLVDVILAFEDSFGIQVADEDADTVNTVGDAVRLICSKLH